MYIYIIYKHFKNLLTYAFRNFASCTLQNLISIQCHRIKIYSGNIGLKPKGQREIFKILYILFFS